MPSCSRLHRPTLPVPGLRVVIALVLDREDLPALASPFGLDLLCRLLRILLRHPPHWAREFVLSAQRRPLSVTENWRRWCCAFLDSTITRVWCLSIRNTSMSGSWGRVIKRKHSCFTTVRDKWNHFFGSVDHRLREFSARVLVSFVVVIQVESALVEHIHGNCGC